MDALFLEFQAAVAGRYSLERELGRGGMGVVYLAREVRLDRLVAIKVLPPEFGSLAARKRFLQEARVAARLSHPNIVAIHAVDEAAEFVFYVMAFVDGQTLAQRLSERGPMRPSDATRVLREVAWALAHAHAQGIVHRDVKPANILIERGSGRALVADFGIARIDDSGGVTADGERLGTPEYMSPEQAAGDKLDGRSDIYSLGIVGFLTVSGKLPFTGDSARVVLAQHITKPPPRVAAAAAGVPRAIADAIDRCLEKEPDARFTDASALAEALGENIETRTEVPIPVRLFLDRRRNLGPLAFSAVCLTWPLAQTLPIWKGGVLARPGDPFILLEIGIILGALPLWYAFRLRLLRAAGYGPDDLIRALRASFQRQQEEFQFEYGVEPRKLERTVRSMTIAGAILTLIVMTGGWRAVTLGVIPSRLAFPMIALPTALTGACAAATLLLHRARTASESIWSTVWNSRFGRGLASLAGRGVRRMAIPADRPTEAAIAMSADALFAELPKAARRALADFPDVVRRLESRARELRLQLEVLDVGIAAAAKHTTRSLVPLDRPVDDFRGMREEVQAQLAEVVTAMETLRLDLLRHRVGALTLDGLTADLAAARELGGEVERLLEAKKEVERAVRPVSPRPA